LTLRALEVPLPAGQLSLLVWPESVEVFGVFRLADEVKERLARGFAVLVSRLPRELN